MTSLDEDRDQEHSYVIQAQTPKGALFVSGRNKLFVKDNSAIDFELHRHVNITVTTTDNGAHSQLSTTVTLSIPIADVNEPPYDILLGSSDVRENSPIGAFVGVVTVLDPDIANPAQWFHCQLLDDAGGRFGVMINRSKIELYLTGNGLAINYEKHASHNITMICRDSGGLSCVKEFLIQVLDANDPPSNLIFSDSLGDTILNPNPPGNISDVKIVSKAVVTVNETADVGITIVAYVHVIDEDNIDNPPRPQTHACQLVSQAEAQLLITVEAHASPNSRRKRSIDVSKVPSEFFIQPGTNSILVRQKLDYERQANYTLYLKCTDDGVPKMSTYASVIVFVLDVPEPPTDVLFSARRIRENASYGAVVCNFKVVDADLSLMGYSFEITTRGVPFRLIGQRIVVSRVPLDHETSPLITVQLTTREVLTTLKLVKTFDIIITDVNEAPTRVTLDGKTAVTVFENAPIGYVIGRFKVEDQDVNDTVFYITIQSEENQIITDFKVLEQNLVVASQLNSWSHDRYILKVQATDPGGLSTVNVLTVLVSEVDVCSMNRSYCSAYATCTRAGPGQASCSCKLGFTGDGFRCDDVDYCNPNPCHRDNTLGECSDGFGGWKNYTCNCKPGWSPPDCDVEINECRANPCNFTGTENCEDIINDFKCRCKPGFSGRLCETNVNDCQPSSCLNGGACVNKVNGYICLCKDPYIGVNCDTDDTVCRGNPSICPRNGTCISFAGDPTKYTCRCEAPWGGNCSGCAPGYGGQNCAPCQYPWTGENCELDWRNCHPNPCLEGGSCYPLKDKDFLCLCPRSHKGKTCDTPTEVGTSVSGSHTGLSAAGLYSLIGCIVLLLLIIIFILIFWWRRRRRKYRSKNARVEYHSRRKKTVVSLPFIEMMTKNDYTFENPSFVAEPIVRGTLKIQNSGEYGPGRFKTVAAVTEIKISDSKVAIACDNPVYESADEVLQKHAGVVHNPLFAYEVEEEEEQEQEEEEKEEQEGENAEEDTSSRL